MPLTPTHAERHFVANRVFTGRGDEKAAFLRALDEPQPPDSQRVLAWHGVGGQGKSALGRAFLRMLDERKDRREQRIARAALDFDNPRHRNLEQALLAVRLQLTKTGGLRFPAFDTAFARYFALDSPGVDMRERHPELFRGGENEILDDLLDWSEAGLGAAAGVASLAVPGVNLLYRYGARLTGRLREWWERRGKRVLAGLDELSADRVLARLPSYLGADICDALKASSPPRIALLVDTYEALWREHGAKTGTAALRVDDWMRLLVQDAPGILVVVLGREPLRWSEVDADWQSVIDQRPLGALASEDAERFLRAVPIEDAAIRRRIIEGAEGLPFYLDLQVDLFEALQERGETALLEHFAGAPPVILARFIDHLGETEERLLRLASYPETLDEDLLNHLATRFLGGAAHVSWGRLQRRSFMTAQEDGRLAMHALMQAELQRREREERPALYRDVHEALFERFDVRCQPTSAKEVTPAHEAALLASQHHLVEADPGRAAEWSLSRWRAFFDAARWRTLERFWTRSSDVAERELGPEHPDYAATLHNLAYVYRETGRYGDAEKLFVQVRAIIEKALGVEHPHYATTLHNLASVYQDTCRYGEAEKLFVQVRAIQEKTLPSDHPHLGRLRFNRAKLYAATGRPEAARDDLEAALAVLKPKLGPDHSWTAEAQAALEELDGGSSP